jgi:predicted nucleotidyltransferase
MRRTVPLSLRPALDAYATRLRTRFGGRFRELRLFGSYARGEATEHSDVDVLVIVDGLTEMERLTVVDEATAVMLETGLCLAPLPLSRDKLEELRRRERALARTLDEEGIPV